MYVAVFQWAIYFVCEFKKRKERESEKGEKVETLSYLLLSVLTIFIHMCVLRSCTDSSIYMLYNW